MFYKIIVVKELRWPFKKNVGAFTLGCFIFVEEAERCKPLIEHEKVHVSQFYRSFGLFPLLYLASKKYRLKTELEAYKVELEVYIQELGKYRVPNYYINLKISSIAKHLSTLYGLDITYDAALAMLNTQTKGEQ